MGGASHPVAASFARASAYVLPASLMLHIGATAFVHHVDFYGADLGPVLLALGLARMLAGAGGVESVWQHRLPILAVLFSLGAPDALLIQGPLGLTLSPLRAILLAGAVAILATFSNHGSKAMAAGAAAGLLLGAAGHSLTAMADNVGWLVASAGQDGTNFVRTAAGWGVLAIVLAFVLLSLGAAASVWKPTDERAAKGDDASPPV